METQRREESAEFFTRLFKIFLIFPRVGEKVGTISSSGKGVFGVLKILRNDGNMTVADIARSWDVSRQYIQKLVNDMVKDDLVEMVDNPKHKKSKLVTLTEKGVEKYKHTNNILAKLDEELFKKISPEEFQMSSEVLKKLNDAMLTLLDGDHDHIFR
jgi:DNA-binding MarR family transcriptional regulator